MSEFKLKFQQVLQNIYDFVNSDIKKDYGNVPKVYVDQVDWDSLILINQQNSKNIIEENRIIFRSDNFKNIFNFIKQMSNCFYDVFGKSDLQVLCKLKTYGKWKNPNKKMVIFKFDFSSFQQLKQLFYLAFGIQNQERLKYIFGRLQTCLGAYFKFSEQCGILLINQKNVTDYVIYHQLIHFIQDVTGNGLISEYPKGYNQNTFNKFQPIQILSKLKQLNTFNLINDKKQDIIINSKQIIPYIHNICYFFERNKIFGSRPLEIINDLIKYTNKLQKNQKSVFDLINKINNNIVLGTLQNTTKSVLIICLIYKQHRTLLKTIIGNYFKDLKNQ